MSFVSWGYFLFLACALILYGFVAAYRAYFFIKGSKIRRVSVFRYEHSVIFGKRADDYEFFSPLYCVFDIEARDNDPSGWKIEQNKYEKERYDTDALIAL